MSPPRATHRTFVALAAMILVAMLVAMGASAAISTTYGKITEKRTSATDPNTAFFETTPYTIADVIRGTDHGNLNDRIWYVSFDGNDQVNVGDLRLFATAGKSVGTFVASGDSDVNDPLPNIGALCFVDTFTDDEEREYRGEDRLNPPLQPSGYNQAGEPLWIKPAGTCGDPFQIGNLRVTATPSSNPSDLGGGTAGTRVTDSQQGTLNDVDHDWTSQELTGANIRFVDLEGRGVPRSGTVYISMTAGNTGPMPGDVRLNSLSGAGGYGSYVEAQHFDAFKGLEKISDKLEFADLAIKREGPSGDDLCSGSATQVQKNLYINLRDETEVGPGDIRLAVRSQAGTGVTSGTPARVGDADLGDNPLSLVDLPAGAHLAYRDLNNNDVFDHGDVLYLRMSGDSNVATGDVRLSHSSAGGMGTCVRQGDSDIHQLTKTTALPSIADGVKYMDAWNAGEYQPGSPVYFTSQDEVDLGAVRWVGFWGFGTHGHLVGDTSTDRTYTLNEFPGLADDKAIICFVSTGGGNYVPEDPVYLSRDNDGCTKNVRSGDVRLSGTGNHNAGTTVKSGDSDVGNPLSLAGNAELRYYESGLGTSADYDPKDYIYLDMQGTESVSIGDVRISARASPSFNAGSKVASGNGDLGHPLAALPGGFGLEQVKFLKALPPSSVSFISTYTPHDIVVYDMEGVGEGFVSFGDIFLVGSGGTSAIVGAPTSPSPPSPPATPQPIASFTVTVDGTFLVVDATGSSAPSGRTITNYVWDFGDGETRSGSNLVQTTNTYEEEGEYTVRLTVTDSAGETSSTTRLVQTDGYVPPVDPDPVDPDPVDPDPADSGPVDPDPDDEEEPTPGPTVLIILAVVGVVLIGLRRRG